MVLECPKCRTAELERVVPRRGSTLSPGDLPFRCPRCEGLWADLYDVPQLLQHPELAHAELPGEDGISDTDIQAGVCPRGHGLLARVRVEVDEGFYLDRCTVCKGVWFDRGEWQQLARRELLHRIPEFWTGAWQRQQRQTKQREDYLGWMRQELGAELHAQLDELAERLRSHPQRSAAITYLLQESRPRTGSGEAGG